MVKGLSEGLLFPHLSTQTAGSRMLPGVERWGLPQASRALASELDQVCGRAPLASDGFVPGSSASWWERLVVMRAAHCPSVYTMQMDHKQAAKTGPSSCLDRDREASRDMGPTVPSPWQG